MSLQAGNTEEFELRSVPAPAPEAAELRPPEVEAMKSSPPKVELPEPKPGANETETASRVSSDSSATQFSSRIFQGTLVSSQPSPISQPSLSFKPKLSTHQRKPPAFLKIFTITLAILKIIFVYAIPGSIFVVLAFALSLALPLAFVAGNGAAVMVIGNAILNKAHVPGYTSNANAAAIGATGSLIAGLIMGTFLSCFASCLPCLSIPREPENYGFASMEVEQQEPSAPWYARFFISLLTFTLGGVLGWAILRHNHVNLGGIDATHAARAAALGSVLLSVGMVFAGPIVLAAIGIILAPLWVAMAMGFKWVHIRSYDSWEQRGNWTMTKSCYCYCYGFCGRDEEIDAELARIGH